MIMNVRDMEITGTDHWSTLWWARRPVAICLLVGLIVVDFVVLQRREVWRAYDPIDPLERMDGCRRRAPDLVIVGGSTAKEGINPAPLVGTSWLGTPLIQPYNLGFEGGTVSEVWHAVRHCLVIPPRLLVYGSTASDFNDSRQSPNSPRALMDLKDVVEWVRARPASAEWVTRHFVEGKLSRLWSLFYYRNAIRLWAADVAERAWPGLFIDAAGDARRNLRYAAALRGDDGFTPRPWLREGRLDRLNAAGAQARRYNFLERYEINGGHVGYLNRLLDWADAHHVSVVIVDMPVSPDLDKRMYPEAFARYRAILAELERTRKLPVLWAARDGAGLDDAHFADHVHLNTAGATRFSFWLRQALTKVEQATRQRRR